ncbi:hypothetical protein [Malaciobacter mytili]|uniref:DUF3649 domain-containing protein n=1 Tax=Malaciobacter mytili LMG 24559 TaxID=1032238 RepID=A0AAX2AKU5_9BACT|nr:hypothetical protein [Malaciobacter mytili]AXH14679.1 putative membrane protein [Malaciobacter mytili LMG 24559]RXI43267.1 hypothetical protein CRU99_08440 [Malaciobacter mytili]RXK16231.1 hypothetical protein CP985_04425 [Malaciobacter mytili LMG 24559]
MIKNFYLFIKEPKAKIGWVHGILACIGALYLSFFSMLSLTYILQQDYAIKILPAMICTPILICSFGIWILFSLTILQALKKILYASLLITLFLIIKGIL